MAAGARGEYISWTQVQAQMIIDRNLDSFIVLSQDSVSRALEKISRNTRRYVCAVSQHGVLEGVLTDGDIRSWLIQAESPRLDVPVSDIMNRNFTWSRESDPVESIERKLTGVISFVPLLDDADHLLAVARSGRQELVIDDRLIDEGSAAFIIAEIGLNHNGSERLARQLIDAAAEAGADCVKFQMRHLESLYRNSGDPTDDSADLGAQYALGILNRFELSVDTMLGLFDHCREAKVIPLCTPFDKTSLGVLLDYGIPAIKIASSDLSNHDLIESAAVAKQPLLVSTGMSSEAEIRGTVRLLRDRQASFAMLHCNSTYPAPYKDVNLSYLHSLHELTGSIVGYSGHERGFHIPVAAVAMGARIIEKHFTYDQSAEGRDHKVSLLPDEFERMVKAIRDVESAMGSQEDRCITQGEMMNREILGKSLTVNQDIIEGEVIEDHMVEVMSPGQGLPPYRRLEIVGKMARRNLSAGDQFFPSDLTDTKSSPRAFFFDRPYGVPVRYHDAKAMADRVPVDFLEFHMSFRDLDVVPADYFDEPLPLDLVVHSPDFYEGDFILDLCATDDQVRERSIRELQNLVDITRDLSRFFLKADRPKVVTSVGGYSESSFMARDEVEMCYKHLKNSLGSINAEGVEILPQTMPPFPWYFGGQRFMNVMLAPEEIVSISSETGCGVCLDVSHSWLACMHLEISFDEFLESVAPVAGHLHIVDARGLDNEGLQIGSGDIDFQSVGEILRKACSTASFIPEIWQGHKNGGEGFWEALEKLEGVI